MSTRELRELERLEWRVLGALRPVDGVTGMPLRAADGTVQVEAAGTRIVRNRSGLFVIHAWERLAAYSRHFDLPPEDPAAGSEVLELVVRDLSGRYLPRLVGMALPRDPEGEAGDSLFAPLDVPLYPAPTAGLGTNWCALRVSVFRNPPGDAGGPGDALGGALLRVVSGGRVVARGLTDWRGEGLVPVAGVPVTTWSEEEGAVVVSSIAATVEVFFDPDAGTRVSRSAVAAGRPPARLPLVDPDGLEARRAALPAARRDLSLAARGAPHLNLGLDLP
ncbi:hypothetical protein [Thauera sinica]|uniref:Uncharacterized protein n=1 Tax=Thauera sinica TaxID=2665146 RepID=A0ABW1AKV3_9RHOO|nr:hypothetical protein [Thauera sp. K11]ATE59868.1 hypothetical protein CCZ27_07830 [Thauera sp. K11]